MAVAIEQEPWTDTDPKLTLPAFIAILPLFRDLYPNSIKLLESPEQKKERVQLATILESSEQEKERVQLATRAEVNARREVWYCEDTHFAILERNTSFL
ncbi:MAG: hypothetical protein ABI758_04280 [Candidatus Woesebacteria bacterium]